MDIRNLRIAVFYDWLNQWGGAERLLLDILQILPHADLYTTIYDPSQTKWLPSSTKIYTSPLNKLPFSQRHHRLYSIFQPISVESFNFSTYDIVISLTSFAGKSILTLPSTFHLCYCLTPNRHLYGHPLFNFYRPIDHIYAQRPDHYLTTSKTVRQRIKKYFKRDSTVIYPGVDTKKFIPKKIENWNLKIENYFLVVSRLVPYKRIDIAIHACQQLNLKLVIVGTGRHLSYLRSISSSNVQFIGLVTEEKLITLYQNCQALICPQEEDFGLTSLEAQACGRPVVAYNRGGIAETVLPYQTGLLFSSQDTKSLTEALIRFEKIDFSTSLCRRQAYNFSKDSFMLNFKKTLTRLWQDYRHTNHLTITS